MNTQLRLHRIISLMVVSASVAMTSLGAAPVQPASARVIVQGVSVEQAAAAVLANHGRVTDKIDIIKSVIADVPKANLEQLAKAAGDRKSVV